VGVSAVLSLAIHLGLPIFMDGNYDTSPRELVALEGSATSPSGVHIPNAFLEVIEGLDLPSDGGG
jgi:hypothetical protein